MVTPRIAIGNAISNILGAYESLSNVRLYMESAPAEAKTPYIIMLYSGGGFTNDAPKSMFDISFDVGVVHTDMLQAEILANQIRVILQDTTPELDNFVLITPITVSDVVLDRSENQNIIYYFVGYRMRIRGL